MSKMIFKNKNTLAVDAVPSSFKLPAGFEETRGSHITVLDPADGKKMKTKNNWSNKQLDAWLATFEGSRIAGQPERLGIGHAKQDGLEAYYEVIEWPEAQSWRVSLCFEPKDLHITIGVLGGDPHDVSKGRETLI